MSKLAQFYGWHCGDGCISTKGNRYQYALTGDLTQEKKFYESIIVPTFNELFGRFLKKPVLLKEYLSCGVCGIYLSNKQLIEFLTHKAGLPQGKKDIIAIPHLRSKEEKVSFLRGLFDTDGSIYFCKSNFKTKHFSIFYHFHYKPKIKVATISKELIDGVQLLLNELGIHSQRDKSYKNKRNESLMHSLVIVRKNDINLFLEKIGFLNQKHLTKIKIWKKFGFCPPKTTIAQREAILAGKKCPFSYYSITLKEKKAIISTLTKHNEKLPSHPRASTRNV